MNTSPGALVLMLFFLMFPFIIKGQIKEQGAKMIAALLVAVFSSPLLVTFYAITLLLFFKIFS